MSISPIKFIVLDNLMHFSDETNTDIFICLSGKTICCLHITHIRVALMDFESESEWFRVIYLFLNKKAAAELMTEKKILCRGGQEQACALGPKLHLNRSAETDAMSHSRADT